MGKGLAITVIGIGALTIYSMSQRKKKPDLFVKSSLPFGFNAITVPPFGIFIKKDHADNKALLQHELIHWRQYQNAGLLRYYVCYGCQLAKYGYDGMPMEQEARVNENDYCKENYTECVRCGLSNTVCADNFRK
jgi:hypothetical protein